MNATAEYFETLYKPHERELFNEDWTAHVEQCIQLWSENQDYDKDTLNNEISLQETADVMKKLKNGKSPSPDNIPNELIKYGGSGLAKMLTDQFNEIFATEVIPLEWLYMGPIWAHYSTVQRER